jgi:hypothetical protein
MKRLKRQMRWLPALILVVLMVGCAADYGRLNKSPEIVNAFKKYEMLADYRYFYSGRENKPSAIIGVAPEFEFDPRSWTELPTDAQAFRRQVERLYPMDSAVEFGAYIVTPDGRRAGVWFSEMSSTVIKLDGDRLIVYSPENMTEEVRGNGGFDRQP